jgi:hypothetical protein
MLCTLITDYIRFEVQCGECLCEEVSERYKERLKMLLDFVAEH